MNVSLEKRNRKLKSRPNFSCSVLGEHDESSRMAVSTWVCALSFGRCRMSKFGLLVYLDFYRILRRTLQRQPPGGTSTTAAAGSLTLASAVVLGAGVSQQRRPNARCAAVGEASEASWGADVAVAHAHAQRHGCLSAWCLGYRNGAYANRRAESRFLSCCPLSVLCT